MSQYSNNFNKYASIAGSFDGEFSDLISIVKSNMESKSSTETKGKAVVILGFSGNGKSTYINKFLETHPDFTVLSMDRVHRELEARFGNRQYTFELIEAFGEYLENICSNNKNVIIDGNFLNLFTRCSLTDTLHHFDYDVTMVNIMPQFNAAIENRIMDKAGEDIGVKITKENVKQYENHPLFIARKNHIMNFHKDERKRGFIDLQIENNCLDLGVEHLIEANDNIDEYINGRKY